METLDSELFKEWLGLAGGPSPTPDDPLGPDGQLCVIDMQADFLPRDPERNPHGGRFGVAEGLDIIDTIVKLVDMAADSGATVCATRDYHPIDHVCFTSEGGPFPAHCVQGTKGAKLSPPIAAALARAVRNYGPERVFVAFKGMHEDIDSFGGFPYMEGGEGRVPRRDGLDEKTSMCPMGCAMAPWTGAIVLKNSSIAMATAEGGNPDDIDMDAPPDVLALMPDGRDRGRKTMKAALAGKKRVFVCGLALDFCVLDTCLNAKQCGVESVHAVLDAARAAHIDGVGSHGSGFISDPQQVMGKIRDAGVNVATFWSLIPKPAAPKLADVVSKVLGFPASLGPFGLARACKMSVTFDADQIAYRVEQGKGAARTSPTCRASASRALGAARRWCRCPRAGPPRRRRRAHVLGVPDGGNGGAVVQLAPRLPQAHRVARPPLRRLWRLPAPRRRRHRRRRPDRRRRRRPCLRGAAGVAPEFTEQLEGAGRFQPVTLPSLLRDGATHFCWLNAGEELKAGDTSWMPSKEGAFLYRRKDAAPRLLPRPCGGVRSTCRPAHRRRVCMALS